MDYLRWAKVHRRVRYELTESGIPQLDWVDLPSCPSLPELRNAGTYGHPALIEALAERYGVPPDRVVPVPGTSSANFIALGAIATHGDLVALERPIYQPMQRVAEFLGLRIHWLPRTPDAHFGLPGGELDSALAAGARVVVITNHHNPSAAYLPPEAIRALAERCALAGARLVVDEVYLDSAAIANGTSVWTGAALSDNVVAVSSLTKVYGLSGLRAGWVIAEPGTAERARVVMDLLSVNNAAPAASLAVWAFTQMPFLERRFRELCEATSGVFEEWLRSEPRVHAYERNGALFALLRLPSRITGDALNDLVVREFETQVVPGRFFELPDHIRVTFGALPPPALREALSRITQALDRLAPGR